LSKPLSDQSTWLGRVLAPFLRRVRQRLESRRLIRSKWETQCQAHWRGIVVNFIASSVDGIDYVLPGMIKKVVAEVPFFAMALAQFSDVKETKVGQDLARAAQDFAICHELAHVVAGDHVTLPDEFRADRWGLAAYWGSWPRQPGLHFEIGRSDLLRASLGPIAFASALRCLLAARVHVARQLSEPARAIEGRTAVFQASMSRSKALLGHLRTRLGAAQGSQAALFVQEQVRLEGFIQAINDYEMAFVRALRSLPMDACAAAKAVARQAHGEAAEF
jgi:hypothetical protein